MHESKFLTVRYHPAMRIISHGIDVVEVDRIAAMLAQHGEQFIQRCFTDAERDYCEAGRMRRPERYAVRFACKEAVFKALGTGWRGGICWRDVAVARDVRGRPELTLAGRCADLARERKILQWHVSLTHTRFLAVASVIACGG